MIDQAMGWLSDIKKSEDGQMETDDDKQVEGQGKESRWLEMIEVLRDITEGKVSYILGWTT